jgi:hypothetical protein
MSERSKIEGKVRSTTGSNSSQSATFTIPDWSLHSEMSALHSFLEASRTSQFDNKPLTNESIFLEEASDDRQQNSQHNFSEVFNIECGLIESDCNFRHSDSSVRENLRLGGGSRRNSRFSSRQPANVKYISHEDTDKDWRNDITSRSR